MGIKKLYDCINMNIMKLSDQLHNVATVSFLKENDLTKNQLRILLLLRDFPQGLTLKEIGKQLAVSKGNLTFIVRKIEEKRLVSRKQSNSDNRYSILRLNSRGKEFLEKLSPLKEKTDRLTFNDFDESELKLLVSYLERLSGSLEKHLKRI
ncbi:MAG: MarR family transcriptional regulator [bacterium]|nr:MarR family transcriptional regulator [bacterium]